MLNLSNILEGIDERIKDAEEQLAGLKKQQRIAITLRDDATLQNSVRISAGCQGAISALKEIRDLITSLVSPGDITIQGRVHKLRRCPRCGSDRVSPTISGDWEAAQAYILCYGCGWYGARVDLKGLHAEGNISQTGGLIQSWNEQTDHAR